MDFLLQGFNLDYILQHPPRDTIHFYFSYASIDLLERTVDSLA
jgi:hypothetical protein